MAQEGFLHHLLHEEFPRLDSKEVFASLKVDFHLSETPHINLCKGQSIQRYPGPTPL